MSGGSSRHCDGFLLYSALRIICLVPTCTCLGYPLDTSAKQVSQLGALLHTHKFDTAHSLTRSSLQALAGGLLDETLILWAMKLLFLITFGPPLLPKEEPSWVSLPTYCLLILLC